MAKWELIIVILLVIAGAAKWYIDKHEWQVREQVALEQAAKTIQFMADENTRKEKENERLVARYEVLRTRYKETGMKLAKMQKELSDEDKACMARPLPVDYVNSVFGASNSIQIR